MKVSMSETPTDTPVHSRKLAVEIKGVSKWFGKHKVLDSVSLSVEEGKRVVLCGPSGSGKSTLIRCLNALEPFQEGTVRIGGHELRPGQRNVRDVREQAGMVFQQFNLFPHLTVLENCTLAPRKAKGVSRKDAETTAMMFLEKVRIQDQARKYPGQLSGGQQQRVAIARALCMRPRLMLFDEPTSALDPEMVKEVLETMVSLAEDGMTMLCVTHEMGFARRIADTILFLEDGKLIFEGPPKAFFEDVESPRIRNFIGQLSH
ncbi:amino acid ABC transporter ATP-binding protein [Paraburkholderia fynbosensis]|uniref:Glutamine transport ATP-binding protein GlnQ n=1 Tax=Paraburkholderia fynbosensis TaxID=1200993 RepID=A0A6J5H7R7_9BURK|nr:amino acid ABC transporter ATP-binding protein [Paraburkholderia fynbosensis]CAB3810445.1 Glutamine transport ATP-binding protein GlnQ [Paraburkholderia fynbosensis]